MCIRDSSKVLKEAQDMGYSFNVGPELEFFLLETNEHGEPLLTTNDLSLIHI